MQDRPNAIELLEAAAQFVEREIVPATDGSRQFQARVVANVMKIIAREIKLEEPQAREEVRLLSGLMGAAYRELPSLEETKRQALQLNQELSEKIRGGEADAGPWRGEVMQAVRKLIEEKLKVANPRYLESDLAMRANITRRNENGRDESSAAR